MKHIGLLFVLLLSFTTCKSSKRAHKTVTEPKVIIPNKSLDNDFSKADKTNTGALETYKEAPAVVADSKANHITEYALEFEGVKYKWGGTTKSGIDCSGLVFESFRAFNIILPRISRDMAKMGEKIPLKKAQEGDLLFFKTRNRRNDINHVGLVIDTNEEIKFIHATTSSGVIVSNLSEKYWEKAYVEVRRVL